MDKIWAEFIEEFVCERPTEVRLNASIAWQNNILCAHNQSKCLSWNAHFMSHNSQFSEMNSIDEATSVALLQNCSNTQ